MKTKIKSITLNLNGQDVVVSIAEAEKLFNELRELFETPAVRIVTAPTIVRDSFPQHPYEIWCGGTTSALSSGGAPNSACAMH